VVVILVALLLLPLTERGDSPPRDRSSGPAGIEMVPLPGGSFTMGDAGDPAASPTRRVEIFPFEISRYEVTQGQWQRVMGENPSRFRDPQRPVERVSWLDVQRFLARLNGISGGGYRLPTEAEWEYAALGGGEPQPPPLSGSTTRAVGLTPANGWGLHGMVGNVWEWVADCWHDDYGGAPATGDPWQEGDCDARVVRGGAWDSPPELMSPRVRGGFAADLGDSNMGFRIARTLPTP